MDELYLVVAKKYYYCLKILKKREDFEQQQTL